MKTCPHTTTTVVLALLHRYPNSQPITSSQTVTQENNPSTSRTINTNATATVVKTVSKTDDRFHSKFKKWKLGC